MNSGQKIKMGIGLFGLAGPLYLVPNHFPTYEPFELPLTLLDRMVPLLPASIYVYLSEYFLIFSAYFLVRDPAITARYLRAMLCLLLVSALVFVLFPTTYPRHLYPLPDGLDPATRFFFELQRFADTPNNCFPSLHVGTVLMAALSLRENRRWFGIYLVWALLISISTLTTKQHYVWDVFGGATLALTLDWYFLRRQSLPVRVVAQQK